MAVTRLAVGARGLETDFIKTRRTFEPRRLPQTSKFKKSKSNYSDSARFAAHFLDSRVSLTLTRTFEMSPKRTARELYVFA